MADVFNVGLLLGAVTGGGGLGSGETCAELPFEIVGVRLAAIEGGGEEIAFLEGWLRSSVMDLKACLQSKNSTSSSTQGRY